MKLLDGKSDAGPNKIVVWGGAAHAADVQGTMTSGLRVALERRGERVATVYGEVGDPTDRPTLLPVSRSITRPVVITTHDRAGKPNALGLAKTHSYTDVSRTFAEYDRVLVFPRR